jgi:hypothetical protein
MTKLVDIIAKSCRGKLDDRGGVVVVEGALNQLLGDGRLVGVEMSVYEDGTVLGPVLGPDTVQREQRMDLNIEQFIFPFGEPDDLYRVGLHSQRTDPNAYIIPATPEERTALKKGIVRSELTRY